LQRSRKKKLILFTCYGNRERSIIAEKLLQQEIVNNYRHLVENIRIESAGLIPKEVHGKVEQHARKRGVRLNYYSFGKRPNICAIQYLAEKGIDVSLYQSRELDKRLVREAGLILAIDRLQKAEIAHLYPEASSKLFTLKEFVFGSDCSNLDIGDPEMIPDVDEETGDWIWPEDYVRDFIREIEQCFSEGLVKFIRYIKNGL